MSVLDVFALGVLLVLVLTGIAVFVVLGMLPGKIAKQRNHPQADAITVCGWCGIITLGLLLPLAFIWAYTNPQTSKEKQPHRDASTKEGTPL